MKKRQNSKFNLIVNKGLVLNKFKGGLQAKQMMESAGLPNSIILRVLANPERTRGSDWS